MVLQRQSMQHNTLRIYSQMVRTVRDRVRRSGIGLGVRDRVRWFGIGLGVRVRRLESEIIRSVGDRVFIYS